MQKILIASDIHGSGFWCEKLMDAIEMENPTKVLLLGDLLYHGPRNPLPDGHNPKRVIELLSSIKDKIVSVRGNCDAEVDQMVLPFPCLADYALFDFEGKTFYLSHGHLASPDHLPPLEKGTVLLVGHTHVPCYRNIDGVHYANCGSVALPKEDTPHSYLVYEDGKLLWKDLETGGIFDAESL
jgi:putative phosphoesterase